MLLDGKKLLITGVLTDDSIAWHTARIAQEQGAEIVCTGFGRGMRLTERAVQRLPNECDVLELDINSAEDMEAIRADLDGAMGIDRRRSSRHRLCTDGRPRRKLHEHAARKRTALRS